MFRLFFTLTITLTVTLTVTCWVNSATAAVILQYHHVSNSGPDSTRIDVQLFAEHMQWINAQGYSVWPLPKLITSLKQRKPIPDKVVVISFDDAYSSIHDNALPILKSYDWPFTVFVATDPINKGIGSFMSWQQIKHLAENKATIANHTTTHTHMVRRLKDESKSEWLERIKTEVLNAEKQIAQQVGYSAKLLAYPYGEYTADIQALISDRGFSAFTQQSGAVNADYDLTAIPRFPMNNVYGELEQFKVKLSSLPMPTSGVTPSAYIIENDNLLRDGLTIDFLPIDANMQQLNCYLSGHGKVSLTISRGTNTIHVKTAGLPPLNPGRSRINCTVPSKSTQLQGRYHWYSHYWMRKLDNGDWYFEE
ncbi:MAG: polysaccharide deacetylase family protein [Pseudomonadales bacterium]|nr:polysaccharide deacetylase family protein [Pseudomonadales bacterium]